MAKIYIDNARYMEFIDDIATQITIQRFGEDTYAPSSEVGQEDVTMFQEDAQDFYNEQYDWVETTLIRTLNIHSNIESFKKQGSHEWVIIKIDKESNE